MVVCPKCGSNRYRCYNETSSIIADVLRSVGSLVCENCTHDWLDIFPPVADDDTEQLTPVDVPFFADDVPGTVVPDEYPPDIHPF